VPYPVFGSEELSHIYSNLDFNKMQSVSVKRSELQEVTDKETKLLGTASLDKRILELRKKGDGLGTIAGKLNCTIWRVRKVTDA